MQVPNNCLKLVVLVFRLLFLLWQCQDDTKKRNRSLTMRLKLLITHIWILIYLWERSCISVEKNLHYFVQKFDSFFLVHLIVILISLSQYRRRHISAISSCDNRIVVSCTKLINCCQKSEKARSRFMINLKTQVCLRSLRDITLTVFHFPNQQSQNCSKTDQNSIVYCT